MNCCYCCPCSERCVRLCCPGLKTLSGSPYTGVKYSQVAQTEKPRSKSGETLEGHDEEKVLETLHSIRRVKMRHALMQGGSQFSLHPQISLPNTGSTPVTEQPSSSQSAFLRRFSLADKESHDHFSNGHRGSGSSVYREKSLTRQKSIDLPDHHDPIVQFSLHYDVLQSKLRIHLEYAADLPKEFLLGMPVRCDPFVILHLEPDRQDTLRSHVIKNTHDPIFNQDFQFGGFSIEDIKRQTLVFRICNHALSNRFIGQAHLPLADVELFGVIMQMKIISTEEKESNFQGDLLLSLSYNPVSRKLTGIISKATGLRKHDLLGKTDPYIKVIVSYKDKVMFKWKSSVKHHTLAPVYNESFSYTLTDGMNVALDNVTLYFFVYDFHHLSPNGAMGVVTIGENAKCTLGRKHWTEIMQSSQLISFWHPIQLATTAQKHHTRSRSPSPLPHRVA